MSNSPLITTMMPTYQRPHLLRRAIRSVLQQTYTSLKVCVYDNGSGDETESVVAEFAKSDPRVHYHNHGRNIGGYANFQYGLDHVSTPFFSILADDDLLLPDFYRVAMAGFEQQPEAICSMCGTIHVDQRGKVWLVQGADWRVGLYPPPEGMMAMLRGQFPPPWTSFLFRREALEVTGPLDESVGTAADHDFQFRLTALRPMVVSNQPGVIVMSHQAAESTRARQKLTWSSWKASVKLTDKIAQDERIPQSARDCFRKFRTVGIANLLFKAYWLKGTLSGNRMLAYRAAVMCRAYGYGFRARVLTIVNKIIRGVPLARQLLMALYRTYIRIRDREHLRVDRRFSRYTRLVEVERLADSAAKGTA